MCKTYDTFLGRTFSALPAITNNVSRQKISHRYFIAIQFLDEWFSFGEVEACEANP